VNAPDKIGFDDDGKPVGVTDFDFAEVEAERRDNAAAIENYRDKLTEFVRFTCDALLSGNPTAEQAGRRAFFFAQLGLENPPFKSQAKLAKHLGITGAAVSQQLNAFRAAFPLISRISRKRT
jgi:hypothetical protein